MSTFLQADDVSTRRFVPPNVPVDSSLHRPPTTFWSFGINNSVPYTEFVGSGEEFHKAMPLGATNPSFRRTNDFTMPLDKTTKIIGHNKTESEILDSVQRKWLTPSYEYNPFEMCIYNNSK